MKPDPASGRRGKVVIEGQLSAFLDHMTGLNILHDGGFTRAY
jgi:3-oxoacyl-[acyl-carrier protein] reductase